MILRFAQQMVLNYLELHKILVILGARQVGKTTLLNSLHTHLEEQGKKVRFLNCDIAEEYAAVNTTSRLVLDRLVRGVDALLIYEAQRLENPGLTLKVIYDLYPQLMVIVTGSSSFDLKNKVSDALTGRYLDFMLPPLSLGEVLAFGGVWDDPALRQPSADAILPNILQYGLYPEIYLEGNPATRQLLLSRIVDSYLFKDILAYQRVRQPQVIVDLARALAYQVGSEVSENELARRLRINQKTVASYIDLLEKSFVVFRLPPYSTNPRREIGKQSKVYFWDMGIRNSLIGDFHSPDVRQDRGAIWENFLIAERLKAYACQGIRPRAHFWRKYTGAEVDYLEITNGQLAAFEIKLGGSPAKRSAQAFKQEYGTSVELINQENYLDFLRIE